MEDDDQLPQGLCFRWRLPEQTRHCIICKLSASMTRQLVSTQCLSHQRASALRGRMVTFVYGMVGPSDLCDLISSFASRVTHSLTGQPIFHDLMSKLLLPCHGYSHIFHQIRTHFATQIKFLKSVEISNSMYKCD